MKDVIRNNSEQSEIKIELQFPLDGFILQFKDKTLWDKENGCMGILRKDMEKKVFSIMVGLLMGTTLLATSCGSVEESSDSGEAGQESTNLQKRETVIGTTAENDLSGCWAFEFDGDSYELPMALSELNEAGWDIASYYEFEDMLDPGEYAYFFMAKDGVDYENISITVCNPSDTPVSLEDCMVIAFEVDNSEEDEGNVTLKLANGIELGNTQQKVESVLGTPDQEMDEDGVLWDWWYLNNEDGEYSYDNYVSISFSGDSAIRIAITYLADYDMDYVSAGG